MEKLVSFTSLPHKELATNKQEATINLTSLDTTAKSISRILVLTPDLRNICGISNYFNTIRLNENIQDFDYFYVNTVDKENAFLKLKRLLINYVIFSRKVANGNYKLIHINPSLNTNSFLRDAIFCLIATLCKTKIIIFFRGWEDNFEARLHNSLLLKFLFNYTYRLCLNFIVLGKVFKGKLLNLGVDISKVNFWIETTVADSSYLTEFSLEKKFQSFEEEINVLFISRIVKSKGTYIAIDAFDILQKKNSHLKLNLIIAGDGSELPAVRQYVTQNQIASVHFLGFVKDARKKEVLLNSHILLFPTHYGEGLPNCILEGMLYGMPIISRYNGAISDVVTHEENGFLSESKDPYIFSHFLQRLVNDKNLYKKMAKINHEKALSNFTNEKVKSRILEIYKQIL